MENTSEKSRQAGKTTKYFKYAIGEIILVVIGILIALQVNNWNLDRLERNTEVKFLKNIKLDLLKDIKNLKEHINHRELKIIKVNNILNKMAGEPINDVNQLTKDVFFTIRENRFVPNNSTFNELSSSGNLNVIKNDSIKQLLLELQENYKTNTFSIDHELFEYREYISKALFNHIDLDLFSLVANEVKTAEELGITKDNFSKLLDSKTYKNGLVISQSISERIVPFYHEVLKRSEKIIQFIDNDISY